MTVRFQNNQLLWVAVSLATTACSRGNFAASTSNCSKTQSIAQNTEFINSQAATAFISTGGFIDISTRAAILDGTDKLSVHRCAAHLDFGKGTDGTAQVSIWTAEHCVNPERDESVSLQIYKDSGYQAFPITLPAMTKAKEVRAESQDLPVAVRQSLMQGFQRTQTATAGLDAVSYCNELTKQVQSANHICASYVDLVRFEIKFPETLEPVQKETLTYIRQAYIANKERALRPVPTDKKQYLEAWKLGLIGLSQVRANVTLGAFADELAACNEASTSDFCRNKTKLSLLLKEDVDELQAARLADPLVSLHALRLAKLKFTEDQVTLMWLQIVEVIARLIMPPLRIHSNMSFVDDKSVFDTKETVGSSITPVYLGLPVEAIAKDVTKFTSGDRGMALPTSFETVKISFQPGDSGSLFSWDGIIPIGVLSTVNNVPFSGGAVLRPLPGPKAADKSTTSGGASASNNKDQGKSAGTEQGKQAQTTASRGDANCAF